MILTFTLEGASLRHMTIHQMGAFVAHCAQRERFYSVKVTKHYVEVSFAIGEGNAKLIDQAKIQQQLEAEFEALTKLDPMPCPCGCGAYIAITPCHKQAGALLENNLSPEEHEMARNNELIRAIKHVRERLGISIREAKDLVDKAYPPNQPF
jgi:hypothetical protein